MTTVADPERCRLTVDLPAGRVQGQDFDLPFEIAEHRRQCLLTGLDETGHTLTLSARIAGFAARYHELHPWTEPPANADAVMPTTTIRA